MNNIPNHVAIIMDGNGRWAKEKGKKRSYGHKIGAKTLETLAIHAKNIGIKILSVYAFSTDNFKRDNEEVEYLMNLFISLFNEKFNKLCNEGVKVILSGRKENLKNEVLIAMNNIEEKTRNNNKCTLNICLNYGGQEEIVDAALKLANDINNKIIKKDEINRESFNRYLYQDLPPIDLLIRTGKEKRLSNFMLFQLSYAELYFIDTYFPDFLEKDLDLAINYFNNKDRRFGNAKTN